MIKQRVIQLSLTRMKKISGKTRRRYQDGWIFSVKLKFHLDRDHWKGNHYIFFVCVPRLNVNNSMLFIGMGKGMFGSRRASTCLSSCCCLSSWCWSSCYLSSCRLSSCRLSSCSCLSSSCLSSWVSSSCLSSSWLCSSFCCMSFGEESNLL